jgi:hypothetical protein
LLTIPHDQEINEMGFLGALRFAIQGKTGSSGKVEMF